MSERDKLVTVVLADEAARRLLLEATELDGSGWVCCPGRHEGQACTLKLTICMHCHGVGCYAHAKEHAACPNTLLDPHQVCVRCGEGAGMNRVIKFGHYVLGEAWRILHGRADG